MTIAVVSDCTPQERVKEPAAVADTDARDTSEPAVNERIEMIASLRITYASFSFVS
jgi:hypothetical protein